jgi:CRP/FNR family cyclic AMP-dependent transcriptional regulator
MDDDIFADLFLFKGLTVEQRKVLRPLFEPCDGYAGTVLFEQGDPAIFLYAVVSGEVVVNFKPDDGPMLTVARVQPGSIVGWSAVLGSRCYTSSAECTQYTQMLRVRGTDLRSLCIKHPEAGVLILDRLAAVIAERLHSTHDMVFSLLQLGLNNPNSKM